MMISLKFSAAFIMTFLTLSLYGQEIINLYDGPPPASKSGTEPEIAESGSDGITRVSQVSEPQLIAYFPEKEKNTGKAVIVFPGGGYGILAIDHEGYDVAERLAAQGIAAFVVKYRLPSDAIMEDKSIGPLQDAQRAIQLVRENARQWGIGEDKIGIAGFSAGGHLASTLGTHFTRSLIPNTKKTSLRPDFMLLAYPVITMEESFTHMGSRTNLLGPAPSPALVEQYSSEKQVSSDTPPTFLVHAEDDQAVPIKNSESFRDALARHNIPVQLMTYKKGGHGFGLNNPTSTEQWFDRFIAWLSQLP
jgi:acetyl esterase/lipase